MSRPRDLYCQELEDRAGKIEAQAIEGFAACLTAATQQSWYNEWSRLCERELNQLQPVEFPEHRHAAFLFAHVTRSHLPSPPGAAAAIAGPSCSSVITGVGDMVVDT